MTQNINNEHLNTPFKTPFGTAPFSKIKNNADFFLLLSKP
jgi:hypothetical protein